MAVNQVPYQPIFQDTEYRSRPGGEVGGTAAQGAFANLGDYISHLATMYLNKHMTEKSNERIHDYNRQDIDHQNNVDQGNAAYKQAQSGIDANPEAAPDILKGAAGNPALAGVDMSSLMPSVRRRLGGAQGDIEKAHTLDTLPTEGDTLGHALRALTPAESAPTLGTTGSNDGSNGNLPSVQMGPSQPRPIQDLLNERNQKQSSIEDLMKKDNANKADLEGQMAQARLGAENGPVNADAQAAKEGKVAGARAAAEEPYKIAASGRSAAEAQTRLNTQLLNTEAVQDYKNAHPADTADDRNRRMSADIAMNDISNIRQEAESLSKRGLMGALQGRWNDVAAGKVRLESLYNSPQDAHDVSQFMSDTEFLKTLAQKVHMGTRGAASPAMADRFDKIINSASDLPIFEGQLDGVNNIMKLYSANPKAPDAIDIPVDPRFEPLKHQQGPPTQGPPVPEAPPFSPLKQSQGGPASPNDQGLSPDAAAALAALRGRR